MAFLGVIFLGSIYPDPLAQLAITANPSDVAPWPSCDANRPNASLPHLSTATLASQHRSTRRTWKTSRTTNVGGASGVPLFFFGRGVGVIFLWLKFQTGLLISKNKNVEGILRLYQIKSAMLQFFRVNLFC